MDDKSDSRSSLGQPDEPAGFAESSRFEARSVTGASYTIVEQTCAEGHASARVDVDCEPRRYHTAYAGLPVVANDDGSFTIVDTHTRLVRVGHP
jgi:hypothetical protein